MWKYVQFLGLKRVKNVFKKEMKKDLKEGLNFHSENFKYEGLKFYKWKDNMYYLRKVIN